MTMYQTRRKIENIIALVGDLDRGAEIVLTRIAQTARTERDADNIKELIGLRRKAQDALKKLSELHPNGTANQPLTTK